MTPLVLRINTTQRVLGLAVLLGCVLGAALLPQMGKMPTFTWCFLGFFGLLGVYISVINFGDRIVVEDQTIRRSNSLLPWWRSLDLRFEDVATATDYEGRAWFLRLEDGKKVVLDHLDGHHELGLLLEESSISTRKSEKPKLVGRRLDPPGGSR